VYGRSFSLHNCRKESWFCESGQSCHMKGKASKLSFLYVFRRPIAASPSFLPQPSTFFALASFWPVLAFCLSSSDQEALYIIIRVRDISNRRWNLTLLIHTVKSQKFSRKQSKSSFIIRIWTMSLCVDQFCIHYKYMKFPIYRHISSHFTIKNFVYVFYGYQYIYVSYG